MTAIQADADARAAIAHDIDATLLVEAAAGTGKTTELVRRIVRVIETGRAGIRGIVAVTFTEKAAGELKLRLREELEGARRDATDAAVSARVADAVANLEEAHVSTIHGFCADLLRERPVEARVDPLFRVLTERQSEGLFARAFDGWFHAQLEDPPEGIRRSLRRTSRPLRPGSVHEDGPTERLRRAAFELAQWRDFPAPWTCEPFDRGRAAAELVRLVHEVAELSAGASYAGDNLYVDTAPIRRLSHDVSSDRVRVEDVDGLESRLVELRRDRDVRRGRKGTGPTYGRGVPRARVLDARDALMQALDDFQRRADADLAARLQAELRDCVEAYEALKRREGALDFLDLLLRARDLVRQHASVRQHFQQRFTRIFVDEFQDTDPLQAELLLLLSADDPSADRWEQVVPVPGKLFIVGDPKQSIYRFRRADVDTYRRVCARLEAGGARRLQLRQSFRSVPNIQRAVNAAFAAVMDGDARAMQAAYIPLEPSAGREEPAAQPSVVALPVPAPYGPRGIAPRAIEACVPDAVAAFVGWLVRESGWRVTERRRPGERVPISPRHVCILFRRFVSFGEDVTRRYVEALEARGVPHLLVGGRAFHDREEIETLRAALMAIEWPDDRLSVFATLKGSLFSIGDEELLEYHHRGGRFHPFARIPADLPPALVPIVDAFRTLAALHRRRNHRPVAETIVALLADTRAHAALVLRPGGEQALANVLHVAELARQYESEGGVSFRGFIDALQAEAGRGTAAEAPVLEESSDGVRLMTVHRAKGLEFPVVVLADLTARLTPFEASRHIDAERGLCAVRVGGWAPRELQDNRDLEVSREQREGERIAYVAATRARDLLVVPAVGDEPYTEGWLSPMNGAIYPPLDTRRAPVPAAGCPPFRSRDSVLNRPDGDPARPSTVCPGEHTLSGRDGPYRVVWWSPEPGVLNLDAPPTFGLRRDDLIVKDVAPSVLRTYLDEYTLWRNARDETIARASMPSLAIRTAGDAAVHDGPREAVDVRLVALAADGQERPGGVRFGALVHAVLADVPLLDAQHGPAAVAAAGDADAGPALEAAIARLAAAYGRIHGAPAEEVAAARHLVQRAVHHPVLRGAAEAARRGRCYREAPVTYTCDDGSLIEGVADLAYETADGFVVVDFKTDRPDGAVLERYRRQVAWYAAAIGRATGRPAAAVLMTL